MSAVARVFKCGNSQAVRLPKAFRVDVDYLEISQKNNRLIFTVPPVKSKNLAAACRAFGEFSQDFFKNGRQDLPPQQRESWA